MNIGDYVRTRDGDIGKYIEKYKGIQGGIIYKIDRPTEDFDYTNVFDWEIIKSSPKIIDLIEENDYINGLSVEKNKYGELYTSYVYYGGDIGKQCEVYTTWIKDYKEDEIYSIVTKEQFKSMEYKLED